VAVVCNVVQYCSLFEAIVYNAVQYCSLFQAVVARHNTVLWHLHAVSYSFLNSQGTRKTLSAEILRAEDPDSPSVNLVYTVLSQGEAKEQGYVERIQSPGTRVDTFTQQEVDQEMIAYVHRGGEPGSSTRLALQVWKM
jgi:hypothetical protein